MFLAYCEEVEGCRRSLESVHTSLKAHDDDSSINYYRFREVRLDNLNEAKAHSAGSKPETSKE